MTINSCLFRWSFFRGFQRDLLLRENKLKHVDYFKLWNNTVFWDFCEVFNTFLELMANKLTYFCRNRSVTESIKVLLKSGKIFKHLITKKRSLTELSFCLPTIHYCICCACYSKINPEILIQTIWMYSSMTREQIKDWVMRSSFFKFYILCHETDLPN